MTATRTYTALSTLVAAAALALSACGGGGDSTDQASAAPEPGTTETVSIMSVDGVGDVLVDADGAALYTSDPEADGDVLFDGTEFVWHVATASGAAGGSSSSDGTFDY